MTIGSGLGGQVGFKGETAYGTYNAPDTFLELTAGGEGLNLIRKQGGGIAAGRFAPLASQLVTVGREATKSFEGQVPIAKFGLFLRHVMGSLGTPVQQGATIAYLQTHTFSDTFGKSLTAQVGVPDTTGTVRPYSYLGGKITKAEFKCQTDDFLTAKLDVDFRDVTEAQALATASYATTAAPYGFTQMSVKAGATVAGATALTGVKSFALALDRKVDTARRYANGGGLKDEPILNDWNDVASGTIEADFLDKTMLADRYAADAAFALVWQFTGALIATPYNYQLTFEMPAVKLGKGTPTVEGPEIVKTSYPFTVLSNGTDPLVTVKYQSTDTTI